MKLYANCDSCQEEIRVKSYASTRTDLEMDIGEFFRVSCKHCGSKQEKHVNDVRAKQSDIMIWGGIALGIILAIVLWKVLGAIGAVTVAIPYFIWQQETTAAHSFNMHMSKRSSKNKKN